MHPKIYISIAYHRSASTFLTICTNFVAGTACFWSNSWIDGSLGGNFTGPSTASGMVNVAINRTSHPRSRTWKAHKLPFDWKCCQARDCDKHCPDISPYWPFLQRTARQTSNVGLAHMRWLLQCSWTNLVLPSYVASNAGGTTPERSNAFRSSKQPHQVRSTHSRE